LPIYKITIDSNRTAILEAEHFNFSQGEGRGDLDKPRERLLNQLSAKRL
jgi:hypothetical protein